MERLKDITELLDSTQAQTYRNTETVFVVERAPELADSVRIYIAGKGYSRMQQDTASFGKSQRERGPGEGYLPIGTKQGEALGGIAANGHSGKEDEQIALTGLKAIKLSWIIHFHQSKAG